MRLSAAVASRPKPGASAALSVALLSAGLIGASWLLAVPRASAQSVFDGYWDPDYSEDAGERGPGPDQGYYAGLPVTAASVHIAQSWDPERLTLPTLECRPHPSYYVWRSVGDVHISEVLDPYTQQQIALKTWNDPYEDQRYIWMDGHPPPPPWAPHTSQGFSVGHWKNGNELEVHTDMLKSGWSRRNGLKIDDRVTMDERFFRDGDIMTDVFMVSDPGYLSEPMVKSNVYLYDPNSSMIVWPCQQVTEIPRNQGVVPMHFPNQVSETQEWAVRHQVPLKASLGGADTTLPQYEAVIEHSPPNPLMKVIEEREQREINQMEGLSKVTH